MKWEKSASGGLLSAVICLSNMSAAVLASVTVLSEEYYVTGVAHGGVWDHYDRRVDAYDDQYEVHSNTAPVSGACSAPWTWLEYDGSVYRTGQKYAGGEASSMALYVWTSGFDTGG